MNTFKDALRRIIRWASSDDCEPNIAGNGYSGYITSSKSPSIGSHSKIDEFNSGFNFTVFSATGGKVVRVHNYNPITDRHISNLYIITDKEDFGDELAQIITRDSLSR